MKLSLQLYGPLARLARGGAPEREFAERASLVEVLREFLAACEPAACEIVFDGQGRVRPSLLVLVNDAQIARAEEPALKDGDRITLLTAIAGG